MRARNLRILGSIFAIKINKYFTVCFRCKAVKAPQPFDIMTSESSTPQSHARTFGSQKMPFEQSRIHVPIVIGSDIEGSIEGEDLTVRQPRLLGVIREVFRLRSVSLSLNDQRVSCQQRSNVFRNSYELVGENFLFTVQPTYYVL